MGREVARDPGDGVPLQGAARRGCGAEAGIAATDMPRSGGGDRARLGVPGPHPHADECASAVGSGEAGAISEGRSSRMFQDEFPHLKKRYWGQHLWARGYFCANVRAVDEDTIRRYIENQQWDDPGENFKITAPTEP